MGVTKSNENIAEQIEEAVEQHESAERLEGSPRIKEDPEKF